MNDTEKVSEMYNFSRSLIFCNYLSQVVFCLGFWLFCNLHLFDSIVSVVCTWGPWGGWSSCSKTCGGGRRNRMRFLTRNSSRSCKGTSQTQTAICNTHRCPGEKEFTLS